MVDAQDYPIVSGYKWYTLNRKGRYHAVAYDRKTGKKVYMHRLLMPNVKLVDHKDGDGLNNRRHNLRPSTKQLNALNCKPRPHSSKYHGVTKHPDGGWVVNFYLNRKNHYCGYFKTEEEAYQARLEAEKKYLPNYALEATR